MAFSAAVSLRRPGFAGWLAVLVFAIGFCAAPAKAQPRDELWVAAAASLAPAFEQIKPLFEARNPGVVVVMQFAASGTLIAQIQQGAPADVLATADSPSMSRAAQAGLVAPQSRAVFASNRLVLVQPRTLTGHTDPGVAPLAELMARVRAPSVQRIVVGNPATAPVGRYAQQALEAAGVWGEIAPKRVLADSARQAITYVARGEVDLGVVYASDAALEAKRVQVLGELPTPEPIRYEAAQVATSSRPHVARAFIAFLKTPAARASLQAHGLSLP
jgi:molybdate transport system substrate-binding protein